MSTRAQRLLRLLDRLHGRRTPVSGAALADDLAVSLRTVYRDIAALREQGADIAGDPGVGYLMRPGFLLPPLMFDQDELEALVLGARWVQGLADPELAKAAEAALTRITATLPSPLRLAVDTSGLFVVRPRPGSIPAEPWLGTLRRAVRDEEILEMDYVDVAGQATCRRIWPFAMAFFDPGARMIAAWCEMRADFRHFRAERVVDLRATGQRYPVRRHVLIRRWRKHDAARHAQERLG